MGEKPELLEGLKVNLGTIVGDQKVKQVLTYDPWIDSWSEVAIKDGVFPLPSFKRSLVFKVVMED